MEEWPLWDASRGVVRWHREEVPYWDPRFGTGEEIHGEGKGGDEREEEEVVATWRDVPERVSSGSSSGSVFYDSLLAQPDATMQHLFPECCPPYTTYPPPDIEHQLLVYFQATGARRLNSHELVEWRKHVFCCRSLVYEACSLYEPNGKSLLDFWLAYEDEQRAAAPGGGRTGSGSGNWRRTRGGMDGSNGGGGGGNSGYGRGDDSGGGGGGGGGRGNGGWGSNGGGGGYGRGRGGYGGRGDRGGEGRGGGRGKGGRGRHQQQHHQHQHHQQQPQQHQHQPQQHQQQQASTGSTPASGSGMLVAGNS